MIMIIVIRIIIVIAEYLCGANFADDNFSFILLNFDSICLYDVARDPADSNSSFVHIMAWSDSTPSHYLVQWWLNSLTNLCVNKPQCVNISFPGSIVCKNQTFCFYHLLLLAITVSFHSLNWLIFPSNITSCGLRCSAYSYNLCFKAKCRLAYEPTQLFSRDVYSNTTVIFPEHIGAMAI